MKIARKWRPPLALVVATVIGGVLCLPILSILYFNFYGKQLVQQTEEALIGQAAVMAAGFATLFEARGGDPRLGRPQPPDARPDPQERYTPLFPSLSLGPSAIQPQPPEPQLATRPALPIYRDIGRSLSDVAVTAQITTLAGFRVIDPFGRIIGGSGEVGYTLGHIEEVQRALQGYPSTLLRRRVSDEPDPPLWSISRSTNFRVFVALPVIVEGHVIGAIYVSRTPGNVAQAMYRERANLALAVFSVLIMAGLIGFVFWRFITRPIYGLTAQTRRAAEPDPGPLLPLQHYGTREVANLGQSFLSMTERIHERSKSIQTYTNHVTHELKSPLTSILGATELLSDPDANLTAPARDKFIANMAEDAGRMTVLLDRLADLASAKEARPESRSDPAPSLERLKARFPQLRVKAELDGQTVPLSAQDLEIVLTHLLENASQHGASEVSLEVAKGILSVQDNGPGISAQNKARVFDPFFTTRRDTGGTGMGLGIAEALVTSAGGEIRLAESAQGARFEISWTS